MNLPATLDTLIDQWCERRALGPLQLMLRAYPGPLLRADQMLELLGALKALKDLPGGELTDEERRMVIEAHHAFEEALKSGGKSC